MTPDLDLRSGVRRWFRLNPSNSGATGVAGKPACGRYVQFKVQNTKRKKDSMKKPNQFKTSSAPYICGVFLSIFHMHSRFPLKLILSPIILSIHNSYLPIRKKYGKSILKYEAQAFRSTSGKVSVKIFRELVDNSLHRRKLKKLRPDQFIDTVIITALCQNTLL